MVFEPFEISTAAAAAAVDELDVFDVCIKQKKYERW